MAECASIASIAHLGGPADYISGRDCTRLGITEWCWIRFCLVFGDCIGGVVSDAISSPNSSNLSHASKERELLQQY